MSGSKVDAAQFATMAEEAEESVINFLATLPADVAKGTVVKAALLLFAVLETEAQSDLCGRDPCPADLNAAEERGWLASDLAKYSKHMLWQSYPDEHVHQLLRGLSPKEAALVALGLVVHVCSSERLP